MSRKDINIGESIGIISSFILLATVVYVYSYSNALGINVLLYFNINDYLNFSVKALLPLGISLLLGLLLRYITDEMKGNNSIFTKREKLSLSISILLYLLIIYLQIANLIENSIAQFIYGSILLFNYLFVVSKNKINIFNNIKNTLFKIMIIILVCVYIFGAIDASNFMVKIEKNPNQEIVLIDDTSLKGNVMFVINEYIVFYDTKIDKIVYVSKSSIKYLLDEDFN